METRDISTAYRLLAELFVNPTRRNDACLAMWLDQTRLCMPHVAEQVERFIESDGATSSHEYVSTLELSPPCPLYLGTHMFEEPSTCSGISTSPRNAFMLELSGMYEHFGFDLGSIEMPDYLPVMLEFMALSLESSKEDTLGLRRRLIEKYLLAGMAPLARGFAKFDSIYGLLIPAIELVAAEDLQLIGDVPMWKSPDEQKGNVSLNVINESEPVEIMNDMNMPEVRP
ncbi:MAG: molecular chaperone TorD family protein [Planctomycetes bacterium]|nr:molecular chaperone TorD family protein [Planctomycetota bacterium]